MKPSGRPGNKDRHKPSPTDATLTAASDTELRRRASGGDSAAFAELTRRRAEQACGAAA